MRYALLNQNDCLWVPFGWLPIFVACTEEDVGAVLWTPILHPKLTSACNDTSTLVTHTSLRWFKSKVQDESSEFHPIVKNLQKRLEDE